MLRAKNIWVVGGDPRQAALAALLADDGHSVHTYALERGEGTACEPSLAGVDRADCVVLPLPAAGADGRLNAPLSAQGRELPPILDALRPGQLVCAGMADEALERMTRERGLVLRDYFAREELAVLNAVPAALAVWRRKGAAKSPASRRSARYETGAGRLPSACFHYARLSGARGGSAEGPGSLRRGHTTSQRWMTVVYASPLPLAPYQIRKLPGTNFTRRSM